MKRTVAAAILVLTIVLFSTASIQPAYSKPPAKIFIEQNGSITPSTAPIVRHGETYVFTSNIRNQIVLERGSIVLDGGGFSLEGSGGGVGVNMTCSNATVQNLNIINYEDGTLGVFNNNTIQDCSITQCFGSAIGIYAIDYAVLRNSIESNGNGITIGYDGHNFIAGNNIINNYVGLSLEYSNNEIVQNNFESCSQSAIILDDSGWSQIIYHNNFVNNQKELTDETYGNGGRPAQSALPFWDNGQSGNYWSDYTGIDVNGDGIGDSPNMITTYLGSNEMAPYSFKDRYPLVTPFNINGPIPQVPNNLTSLTITPSVSNANDQAVAFSFLKNVIQLDASKYEVTLAYDIEDTNNGFSTDYLGYGLVQQTSTFDRTANAVFAISNNAVTSFSIQPTGGQLFFTTPTTNSVDSAKRIMQNYQTWTHDSDVNKMVNLLNTVGSEKNADEISGNIELKVSTTSERTSFSWSYIYNGADYPGVNLEFQNLFGLFSLTFSDNRGIYSIGNTNVNISQQKAIQTAEDYVRSLSYPMNYGNGSIVTVRGLIVNGANTTSLSTTSQGSAVLDPYWSVQVSLSHSYPGETYAVTVGVWAGNGTVFTAQRDVVPKSFPVPSYAPPSLYASIFPFLPIFIPFLFIVALLIYLLLTINRRSRTHREIFVSGRTARETKDEVLRWFSQNRVEIMENNRYSVKGKWGTGIFTAAKYFQVSFKPAEGGAKVYTEGWIGFFGLGEQSFSSSALMGWIPRREGWKAMERLWATLTAMSTTTKVCPQCGRTLNGNVKFCQYCGKLQ